MTVNNNKRWIRFILASENKEQSSFPREAAQDDDDDDRNILWDY